ncbi:MAG: hypothetical protein JNL73_12000 [Anaerolineales bacterium]|nr:hypothetical protein [Anaerolineales bacterium]
MLAPQDCFALPGRLPTRGLSDVVIGVCAALMRDAVLAQGPETIQAGPAPVHAVRLLACAEEHWIEHALAVRARHFAVPDRQALVLQCFNAFVRALTIAPTTSLVVSDLALAPDPDRTWVGVRAGVIEDIWPATEAYTGSLLERCQRVGREIARSLDRLIPPFARSGALTPEILRGAASDQVAQAIAQVGQHLNHPLTQDILTDVMAGGAHGLRPVELVRVTAGGRSAVAVKRAVCCLADRLDADATCLGCPHDPEPTRTDRLKTWLQTLIADPP